MSVFTKVSLEQLSAWLKGYDVGAPVELQGIAAGIENTNYFVTTTQGRFVLTLFEKLTEAELPFYLDLMAHLAKHGIPCPAPVPDRHERLLGRLNGRPATLVSCLPGSPVTAPDERHCALIGATLAEMHLAGRTFGGGPENPRGPAWWKRAAPEVIPFLDTPRRALLESELAYQTEQLSAARRERLPHGPIHADLFRDNALWDPAGDSQPPRLGGVIDFYFAGIDCWLFDVAVALNDWCVYQDGETDPARARALLGAYRAVRDFTPAERESWQGMLRAGALRFWLSRLHDFYLPRPGDLTHAHDPEHFRRILEQRRAASAPLP